jgi:hypothetical protein
MRKVIIFGSLLFITGMISVNAQTKLSLAPVVGLNFNIHNGSDLDESSTGFGMVIGGQADITFNRSIGLQTNLMFFDKRSASLSETQTEGGVTFTSDNSVSLTYLQIEPLLKVNFPSNFYLLFGPTLGFNLSAESENEITIETPGFTFEDGSTKSESKGTIRNTSTRFELKAGAGVEIPLSYNLSLTPQVTFAYGLTNVVEIVEWKIMSFQALVGVKFAIM